MQLRSLFFNGAAAALLLSTTLFQVAAHPGCPSPPSTLINGELTMGGLGDMNNGGPTNVNGWFVSHGSPSTGTAAPGGGSNGIWMWSYSGYGEGIYSCYNFQAGRTYRICLWAQNTRNSSNNPGNLMIYAATGLNGNGPGSNAIAVPASSQLISNSHTYSGTWVQLSYTFTANANYSQLWIYPFRAGPSIGQLQYELNIDRIQCVPVDEAGEECYISQAPCVATFKTAIGGLFYLNGSPTRIFTIDQYSADNTYIWDIDGAVYNITGPGFSMDFTPGIHKVCLTVITPDGTQCRFCQTFCVIIEEYEAQLEGEGLKPGSGSSQGNIVRLAGSDSKVYKLYPNPAGSELSLEYFTNEPEKIKVELLDMTGRILKTVTLDAQQGNNTTRIDTRGISSGSYSVKVAGEHSSKTLPVSVVK